MQRFLQDLRFSTRTLRKSPGFSLTAILTLAVGIGAVTSIFSVVNSVLLKPFAFPNPGQLVILRETDSSIGFNSGESVPDNPRHFFNWQANAKTLAGAAIFQSGGYSIGSGTDHPEIVDGLRVSSNFFSVLGVQPALGRSFLPVENTKGHGDEVILSWGAFQRYFHGDPGAIGKTLRSGGVPQTVVGVLPRGFQFPSVAPIRMPGSWGRTESYQVFSPITLDPADFSDEYDYNYLAVARVRAGVSIEQARSELNTIQAAFDQAHHLATKPGVVANPLITDVAGNVSTALWLLLAAVGAVLLIGCVNLANLQLARAVARDRELAVRAALGAARDRLLGAALADSFVLAFAGGVLGILLSFLGVRVFLAAAPTNLPRLGDVQVSWPVLLGAAGLSVLTAFVFGLLPALRAMRIDPQTALQSGTTRVSSSRESRRTRHLLVGAEVACTVALLIVTGLLVRSFATLLDQNREFDSSHVTYAQVFLYAPQYGESVKNSEQARGAFEENALAALGRMPGVQTVASTSETPMGGETWINLIQRPDRPLPVDQVPQANIRWISPSYATTLRIPLVAGRDFTDAEKNHPDNALISEKAARSIWPGENPVGHTFKMGDDTVYTVVGVLADARINDLQNTANMVYLPYWQNPWWRMNFLIRSPEATAGLTAAIRRALWNIDPEVAIPVIKSLDEQVADSVANERFQTLLLSSFGGAALLLALLGIYGVLAYSVSLRRQEFGIRIALGSDKGGLMRLIARQAAVPIVGGILAGVALAFAATRWVQSLLYKTSTADPVAIAVSIGLLLLTALLAVVLPARRAAQTDPMQVLRNE
ncbi:MAG TPA: ABC transporter permease [Acidobacteriaceae bacterium]|jgi:predicted permease